MALLDQFEVVKPQDRISAVKCLLYLAHGNYAPGIEEGDLERNARENIFLLLEMGVYNATVELLALEMEQGKGIYEGSKSNITIADNHNLRVCLSLIYIIVETVRREDAHDKPEWMERRKTFMKELQNAVVGDDMLTSLLFAMLLSFCNGSMPHYPIRKLLLLIWKTILSMMGGFRELAELKQQARVAAGLPPHFPEPQPSRYRSLYYIHCIDYVALYSLVPSPSRPSFYRAALEKTLLLHSYEIKAGVGRTGNEASTVCRKKSQLHLHYFYAEERVPTHVGDPWYTAASDFIPGCFIRRVCKAPIC